MGSEAELQTQIELAVRRKYSVREQAQPLLNQSSEVGRMLNAMHSSLKERQARLRAAATALLLAFYSATLIA